jgi:integrase
MANTHTRYKIDRSFLRGIKPTGDWQEFSDAELRGFTVKVTPTGTINYTYRWRKPDGTQGRRTIGRYPAVQPAEARELARKESAVLDHKGDTLTRLAERKQKRTEAPKVVGVPTVRQFLTDSYEPFLLANRESGSSAPRMIRQSFVALLNRPMDEVTAWDIEKWRSECHKRSLKTGTTNRYLGALRGLFSRAVEWEVIGVNPLKPVKKLEEDDGIVRFLSDDEESSLRLALVRLPTAPRPPVGRPRIRPIANISCIDATATPMAGIEYLTPAVLVSLNTGLRRGELLKLEWTDIDLDRAILTVRGKTAKSKKMRHIPLNREALATLKAWKLKAHPVFVFTDALGKPLRAIFHWEALRRLAGLKVFRWHDLRHSFAPRLVMKGVDLNTVRELLGHKDLKMTLRYAHLSPGHKAAAVSVLDRSDSMSLAVAA